MSDNRDKAGKNNFSQRKEAIIAVSAVVILYVVLENFGITCPIKFITGISCAGCGMSRAWLALIRLDINAAFGYHPLFFLPPVALVLILFKSKINIKIYKLIMFTIVMSFVIVYMYRMIWGNNDVVVFAPRDSIIYQTIKKIRE